MKHTFNIKLATQFGVDIALIMRVFKQFNFTSKNNPEDNFCYALSVAINGDSK